MNNKILIDLTTFVDPPHTDLISGREFGEDKANKLDLITHIKSNDKFIIEINDKYVKAINDSFIKGFFNKVFEQLKTKVKVKEHFEIKANDYYLRLFDKNFSILESLYANSQ